MGHNFHQSYKDHGANLVALTAPVMILTPIKCLGARSVCKGPTVFYRGDLDNNKAQIMLKAYFDYTCLNIIKDSRGSLHLVHEVKRI